MPLYFAAGSKNSVLSDADLARGLTTALEARPAGRVLAIPPDFTRFESRAGRLTCLAYQHLGDRLVDVLPALGTHFPMADWQLQAMFPTVPAERIRPHRWRDDVVTLGEVPAEFVQRVTGGLYDQPWPAQMNRLVVEGGHDLILSIGQVVPHEVLGMANYNKNIFIGTGGAESINASHYLSSILGIENILGRSDNPLRQILNEAQRLFCQILPLLFVLTVIGIEASGETVVRGLFIGDDNECFEQACALATEVNITKVDQPVEKMVAFLDSDEFHSTWIGNKAIYRTRMAIADGGELVVLAPGIKAVGEDPEIDRLIRKYGYRTTEQMLSLVEDEADLASNLSAAAHIMHSASEGRFRITYCPGHLTREEVEALGFQYGAVGDYLQRYPAAELADGWNTSKDGERFYFVGKPALGLWAHQDRLPAPI